MASTPDRHEYQIAIICALKTESDAVEAIFDELYESGNTLWEKADGDQITYTLGRIGRHHVVLAHMPGTGKVNAAITASSIRATFPSISRGLTLVVGVCGGAPTTPQGRPIFLGDVIISTSVQQADFGRELTNSFAIKSHLEGNLGAASPEIQSFLHKLQTQTIYSNLVSKTALYAELLVSGLDVTVPDLRSDQLFPSEYLHKHQNSKAFQCQACSKDSSAICTISQSAICAQLGCRSNNTRIRPDHRLVREPFIYFGPVCSTDAVKRNGLHRDELISSHEVIAFEMEGAGVWNSLPSLVVKAVCDYADSHKNKKWQDLAAVNAAACCKAVIEEWLTKSTSSAMHKILADPAIEMTTELEDSVAKRRARYLRSLHFELLETRHFDINFAYPGTCDWMFRTSEFESWLNSDSLDSHHGILWIKGKPGSGKSVLMKHILQATHLFKHHTSAAYFFHARGEELQHSILGLYRSLLHQVLAADTPLLDKFIEAFPIQFEEEILSRIWKASELQHFLLLGTRQGWIKRLALFIDALDECDHREARELVSFCEDLALNGMKGSSQLLICLSIRHFPNISIRKCVQVNIDSRPEHEDDIAEYVCSKIRVTELADEICRRSKHLFLWAVLVVHILNEAFDRGSDMQSMRKRLATIPTGLDAVFRAILEDPQNSGDDPTFMFQLVFYTYRSLTPLELYILSDKLPETAEHLLFQCLAAESGIAEKYILTVSKGLLESKSTGNQSTEFRVIVQFIHESFRDYLGYTTICGDAQNVTETTFEIECHEKIAQRCIEMLYARALLSISWDPDSAVCAFRALRYADDHVLDHIAAVQDSLRIERLLKRYAQALMTGDDGRTIFERIASHWPRWLHWQGAPKASVVLSTALACCDSLVRPGSWSRKTILENMIMSRIDDSLHQIVLADAARYNITLNNEWSLSDSEQTSEGSSLEVHGSWMDVTDGSPQEWCLD